MTSGIPDIHIDIYIYIERERDIYKDTYVYIYIYIYAYLYVYIYIYIYDSRLEAAGGSNPREVIASWAFRDGVFRDVRFQNTSNDSNNNINDNNNNSNSKNSSNNNNNNSNSTKPSVGVKCPPLQFLRVDTLSCSNPASSNTTSLNSQLGPSPC